MCVLSSSPLLNESLIRVPHLAKEEQEAAYGKIIKDFTAGYPDWSGVLMLPEESVTAMLDTISKLTPKDSGAFTTHRGDTKDWL